MLWKHLGQIHYDQLPNDEQDEYEMETGESTTREEIGEEGDEAMETEAGDDDESTISTLELEQRRNDLARRLEQRDARRRQELAGAQEDTNRGR